MVTAVNGLAAAAREASQIIAVGASYQALQHRSIAVAAAFVEAAQVLENQVSRYRYLSEEYEFLSRLIEQKDKKTKSSSAS